jgi:hypothetical protein
MLGRRSFTYMPAGPRRGTRIRYRSIWLDGLIGTTPPKSRKKSSRPASKRQIGVQVGVNANAEDASLQPQPSATPNSSTTPSSEANTILCSDLPPERQSRADEYIGTLTAIEDEAKDIARIQSLANIDNESCQSVTKTLASIERLATMEKETLQRNCKKMIEEALKKRDQRIEGVNTRTKAKREQAEKLRAGCIARLDTVEARISEINARTENHRKRKLALEAEGGFQLGLDVGLMERAKKRG